MNNFLKEYQEFYKAIKTLPARISKQVVADLTQLVTEKYMDLYDLINEQNYNCKCSNQSNTASQMEDINNLLEQLEHIKKESERVAADNVELRKQLVIAKDINGRLHEFADKINARLEEANNSLKEYKLKAEELDKECRYYSNAEDEAREDAIYWEKKYRELSAKYFLLHKKKQGTKSDKIEKKIEELNFKKKAVNYRDGCIKAQLWDLVPSITYTNNDISVSTKNSWTITVSGARLY